MAANPFEQFEIKPLVELSVAGMDISFTNSALWMSFAVIAATGLMVASVKPNALVPGRMQVVMEMMYETVASMVRDNIGSAGRAYFPLVFTLFMFILFGNMMGMAPVPGAFTFTSHVFVTFAMAITVFLGVTLLGLYLHGMKFFSLFLPSGVPGYIAPLIIAIELISYCSRPITLAVRLFANMTVGHVMLKVIAGFIVPLGIFGIVPFMGLMAVVALEFLIAFLQAYIFAVLTCIYLHDAVHLH